MKKIISLLGMTASLVFASGSINGDSSISTTIEKNCILSSLTPTINFGTINPVLQDGEVIGYDNVNQSPGHLSIGIMCSNTTPVVVNFTSANNWKLKNNNEEIYYNIKNKWYETEIGTKTLTLHGAGLKDIVTDRSFFFTINKNTKPGTYTDTVTITWTW
jgi:spore coat protein U-like protein